MVTEAGKATKQTAPTITGMLERRNARKTCAVQKTGKDRKSRTQAGNSGKGSEPSGTDSLFVPKTNT